MLDTTSWLIWGFAATILLTSLLAGSQGAGMTRMNLPFLLGTMVTPNRDRATILGVLLHVLNGWILSLVYVLAFHTWDGPTWWKGATIGAVHAAFVLVVLMPALPGMHPRMASEQRGPTVVRQLEPPGFLSLHYGRRTPISVVLAHVAFGIVLGAFYRS